MAVILVAESGPLQGERFEFVEHDTFLFGRAPDCQAQIPESDTSASRHHFVLEVAPPCARVRDLGSTNGTYVGSRCLRKGEQCDLQDGDVIEVGATRFRVSMPSGPRALPGRRAAGPDLEAAIRAPTLANYEIVRTLGEGAMGAVFLARRHASDDLVALKVMLPAIAHDAQKRSMFLREAETMLRLQHPNLLAALEVGEAGPGFFVSMPFCEWGSVSSYMERYGSTLPWEIATAMFRQLLAGLAFAHARGFVHRDLKPDNVLVSAEGNGTIKIADFGLAKSFEKAGLSGMTVTGGVGGTPLFMPREQLVNFKRVKPCSDVWSAAATFYHMVTGQFPRDLEENVDPIAWVLHAPIVPLSSRAPQVPSSWAAVIDRALDAEPGRRPPDAGAFLQELCALS